MAEHSAASNPQLTNLVQTMLKNGKDINAPVKGYAPLHRAVYRGNVEQVCTLLYYGADVNVLDSSGMTPLMCAIINGRLDDTAEILFGYYDDYNQQDEEGSTALLLALEVKHPIASKLIKAGADVNSTVTTEISDSGEEQIYAQSLWHAVKYDDGELFKLMWPKFDYNILLNNGYKPFILHYINSCCFPAAEWLECLYLILNSPVANDLMQECSDDGQLSSWDEKNFLLLSLIKQFYKNCVAPEDRIAIIYICLNLGAEVNIFDISFTYQVYGFNEELEALIYGVNMKVGRVYQPCFPLTMSILTLDDNFNADLSLQRVEGSNHHRTLRANAKQDVFSLLKVFCFPLTMSVLTVDNNLNAGASLQRVEGSNQYRNLRANAKQDVFSLLEFHSVPSSIIEKYLGILAENYHDIRGKICAVPEVPTLVELSRNKVRRCIRQACKFQNPFRFHDVIKDLKLAPVITDVLRLKIPIREIDTSCRLP